MGLVLASPISALAHVREVLPFYKGGNTSLITRLVAFLAYQ